MKVFLKNILILKSNEDNIILSVNEIYKKTDSKKAIIYEEIIYIFMDIYSRIKNYKEIEKLM